MQCLDASVERVLEQRCRTRDICQGKDGEILVVSVGIGDAIVANL